MKNIQNVLIVHNYYRIPGGEDTVVLNEKHLLEQKGHNVTLYSRRNSDLDNFTLFKKFFIPFIAIFNPKTFWEIKKIINEKKIDIVHVHNTLVLISPSVYYAAFCCKIPVVQTIHNFRLLCPGATFYRDHHICEECIKHGQYCAIKYKCYRNSRIQTSLCVISEKIHCLLGIYKHLTYICLSEFNKQKMCAFNQIKKEQIFIKPNFIESNTPPIPFNRRKRQFVFAGRLDELKGIELLLKTWKKMGDFAPQLVVCGVGPMELWCKKFVKNNNLYMIELKGFIANDKIKELMAESYALLLPSQWYEGFPMTMVEAFSVGTPVIGSDIGNVESYIIDGVNGYHFKHNSSDSLISTIKSFKNIVEKTYAFYNSNFTSDLNYSILKKIYLHASKEI